jgi:hypothetical protein
MITLEEYLMNRDTTHALEFSPAIRKNALATIDLVNRLLILAKGAGVQIRPRKDGTLTNSGWRPPSLNAKTPGASRTSLHMTGQAIDLHDPDGKIARWCMEGTHKALSDLGLWLEHPDFTPGWCHLQTKPPPSGNRVFRPRATP